MFRDFFYTVFSTLYDHDYEQGFGPVVRAASWHDGDPGSDPGRDGLYTFRYMHTPAL
jgi:hypothetical protein